MRLNTSLLLAAALLALGSALACHDPPKPRDLGSVSITLERTPCYGHCPVYTVTVHGNGMVEYLGKSNVDIPGAQMTTVDPQRILDLLRSFKRPAEPLFRDLH